MGALRSIVLVLVMGASAWAEDRVQGFVAPGRGEVAGQVIDSEGQPVRNARVHLVTKKTSRVITTDGAGRYRVKVDAPATLVFVHGDVKISGATVSSQVLGGIGEAIVVREMIPPAKPAKPKSDPSRIPEYTDEAMTKDAWTRAWLLLEVAETGRVARLKLLNPPGYGLDPIAIRDGFKLEFEPARDDSDRAVRSHVLWMFEWPSFWWMRQHGYARRRLPRQILDVQCRGTGPTHAKYRDCSPANVGAAIDQPWLERPRK